MTKLGVLCAAVALSGCGNLILKLRGENEPKPGVAATARADILAGTIQILDGERLTWWHDSHDVYGIWIPDNVTWVLDGPGVHEELDSSDRNHGAVDWNKAWGAGTYTLRQLQFGKELTHRTFEVKRAPTAEGGTIAYVAIAGPPALVLFDNAWDTTITMSVVRPVVSTQFVWMKGNEPIGTASDDVLRMGGLARLGPLGTVKSVRGTRSGEGDLTGATLYLFEYGDELLGAWRYTGAADGPQLLPPVRPASSQLSAARAAAADAAQSSVRWVPDLRSGVDESVACAAAANPKAREAYLAYDNARVEEGLETNRQLRMQDAQEDPTLRRDEREELKSKQRQAGRYTIIAGEKKLRSQDVLKATARTYKKGCLAALGIPMMEVPAP